MTAVDPGAYRREITTTSETAKKSFDDGLIWIFGFNHEMAAACFETACAEDPKCGMAYWGLAYAIGPNYNRPWTVFSRAEKIASQRRGHHALHVARTLSPQLKPVENALIEALASRYPVDPDTVNFRPWNDAFAAVTHAVHTAFPDDLDVV